MAPDVMFLTDIDGQVSAQYGIYKSRLNRGYFVTDSKRKLFYHYISLATVLKNQTATLLMEVDKMTGQYNGKPETYSAGGILMQHADAGNDVGKHAIDFNLQAQCGANLTLYNMLKLHPNGIVLTFFEDTGSQEAINMFERYRNNLEAFQSRGFGVIGINDSPPETNMAFAKLLDIKGRDIIFFYDKNGKVGSKYNVYKGWGFFNSGSHKTAYLIIDSQGIIRARWIDKMMPPEILINSIDSIFNMVQ